MGKESSGPQRRRELAPARVFFGASHRDAQLRLRESARSRAPQQQRRRALTLRALGRVQNRSRMRPVNASSDSLLMVVVGLGVRAASSSTQETRHTQALSGCARARARLAARRGAARDSPPPAFGGARRHVRPPPRPQLLFLGPSRVGAEHVDPPGRPGVAASAAARRCWLGWCRCHAHLVLVCRGPREEGLALTRTTG